jgi:putative DNA primase/helicase
MEGCARDFWPQICEALDEAIPGLVEKLFVIETPSGGIHVPYRREVIGGCDKYAMRAEDVPEGTQGAKEYQGRFIKIKTLIETTGEGGYVVTYPSSSLCHPIGKEYFPLAGDWLSIPVLAVHERQALLNIAASFNEVEEEKRKVYTPPARELQQPVALRPGDDFNLRASWAEVLEPYGWNVSRSVAWH